MCRGRAAGRGGRRGDLESDEALGFGKSRRVIDRESDYSKRRLKRKLSLGRDGKVRAVETDREGAVRGLGAREEGRIRDGVQGDCETGG